MSEIETNKQHPNQTQSTAAPLVNLISIRSPRMHEFNEFITLTLADTSHNRAETFLFRTFFLFSASVISTWDERHFRNDGRNLLLSDFKVNRGAILCMSRLN